MHAVEALEREGHVAVADAHPDDRLVRGGLEADHELVAVAADPVRRIRGLLVRPHELCLVVERTVLRNGEHRHALARVDGLLSGRLHDERLRLRVVAYDEGETLSVQRDVAKRGKRPCCGNDCK